jgi:cob(I)alamin adenosyltransferase
VQNLQSRLNLIKQKVEMLMAERIRLQGDLDNANNRINVLENELNQQKSDAIMLKDQNKMIKLAKNLSKEGKDTFDVKIKINQVLKEIDKCIDILNDDK